MQSGRKLALVKEYTKQMILEKDLGVLLYYVERFNVVY